MKYTSTCIAVSRLHSNSVTLALDDLHDLRHIFLAGIVIRGFHHHAHQRFRAGLADQNAASVAQCLGYGLDCCQHCFIILCSFLASITSIIFRLVRIPSPVLAYLLKII